MDELRTTLGAFDPDAPLPPAPDPWTDLPMPALRDGPPWAMAEMIAAEPALVARIAQRVLADGSAAALATELRDAAAAGRPVIVTGCGTSEHAAMGVAAVLRDAWRIAGLDGWGPVSAQAFELALDPPSGGLVIGISHEGGSAATIAAMRAARDAGARVGAITGTATSTAGRVAHVVLATVEMDRSWCHTVGYVSPLAAGVVVAGLLGDAAPRPDALGDTVREGIDAAWRPSSDGRRPATTLGGIVAAASHVLVVASGADRITARELVLKIEEAAYVPSAARDLETFLHGHLPATGEDTALVLVLTETNGLDARAKRSRQALAAAAAVGIRCGAILSASAGELVPPALTPHGRIVLGANAPLDGASGSLLGAAGPLQLLTLEAAAARGTNPDPIRRDDPRYLNAADLADDPSI